LPEEIISPETGAERRDRATARLAGVVVVDGHDLVVDELETSREMRPREAARLVACRRRVGRRVEAAADAPRVSCRR
jgi:hypothetical protein